MKREMTMKDRLLEVIESMCDFVNRASKEGATPEEIAALPEVASQITDMTGRARFDS